MIGDWIYPETDICFACGDLVEGLGRARFCSSCRLKLQKVEEPFCKVCGKPIADGDLCQWCSSYSRSFSRAFSPYLYAGLARELILSCKYKNHPELARAMGGEMARYFQSQFHGESIDWIVPVPIHRSRYRDRGYNQAGLIAGEIGRCLKLPVRQDWLGQKGSDESPKGNDGCRSKKKSEGGLCPAQQREG